MFDGWNGTKVVSTNQFSIEYNGNSNEQENANDVVMGGVHFR